MNVCYRCGCPGTKDHPLWRDRLIDIYLHLDAQEKGLDREQCIDALKARLVALDWQPGSEPPPQPGQYEVASRRDRFNGLGERAPGAGPWFYEHRNWTGKRWMAGDAAAAVLWWRVVPPTPEEAG